MSASPPALIETAAPASSVMSASAVTLIVGLFVTIDSAVIVTVDGGTVVSMVSAVIEMTDSGTVSVMLSGVIVTTDSGHVSVMPSELNVMLSGVVTAGSMHSNVNPPMSGTSLRIMVMNWVLKILIVGGACIGTSNSPQKQPLQIGKFGSPPSYSIQTLAPMGASTRRHPAEIARGGVRRLS